LKPLDVSKGALAATRSGDTAEEVPPCLSIVKAQGREAREREGKGGIAGPGGEVLDRQAEMLRFWALGYTDRQTVLAATWG
jgi:hypothetical protein